MALQLTDNITQSLVVILFRLQTLVGKLPVNGWPSRGEVVKLTELLGETAQQVERISHSLRPSVLRIWALSPPSRLQRRVLKRTGMRIKLACVKLSPLKPKLAPTASMTLRNVEKHARARHVTVSLRQRGAYAHSIKDDGIGFDPDRRPAKGVNEDGFGLLRMRERADFLKGVLTIKSSRRTGTEIKVRIPLSESVSVTGDLGVAPIRARLETGRLLSRKQTSVPYRAAK